jgi:hypothetical protein
MPIVSKRIGSQSTISRQQRDNQYDDYAYYPYYSKSTPNYNESRQSEDREYYPTNNSSPVHRT